MKRIIFKNAATILACAITIGLAAPAFHAEAIMNIDGENVVAGAGGVVSSYATDEETRDAVRKLLELTEEETTPEESETEPEETTTEPEEETTPEESETEPETTTEAPTEPEPKTQYIVSIAEQYVNVRSTPDTSSTTNVIAKMYPGDAGEVIGVQPMPDGVWYLMQSGDVTGYVRSDFFMTGDEADAYIRENGRHIGTVTNAQLLNVRAAATTNSDILTQLSYGDQYAIVGEENGFYLIALDESFYGYVSAAYVTVTSTYKTAITIDEERIALEKAAEEEAQRLAAEEAAREAELARIRAEQEAAERERLANTCVGIQAYYTGSGKVAGQAVTIFELSVAGIYGDGSARPIDGWACGMVGVPLSEGENIFVVEYGGYTASFSVLAATPQAETPPQIVEPVTEPPSSSADPVQPETPAPSQDPGQAETPEPSQEPATQPSQSQSGYTPSRDVYVPCDMSAAYAGSIKYAGQTVTRDELQVVVVFTNNIDYAYHTYVYDWECEQVGVPLPHGDTVFHITYKGVVSYDIVVNAYSAPTDDSLRSQIVNYAVQFLGNPYVYAGNSLVNGTDCSGFTMLVYQHFGYSLSRSSREQVFNGRQISYGEMQPGDLLFYTDSSGVIRHVSMYIGEGKVIHAANENLGIIISNVTYRAPAYIISIL